MILKLKNTARKGRLYEVNEQIYMADVINKRLPAVVGLENDWLVAKEFYGQKVAEQLFELVPSDPFILRDYMLARHFSEGKSKEEAEKLLRQYSEEDWGAELTFLITIVKKSSKLFRESRFQGRE